MKEMKGKQLLITAYMLLLLPALVIAQPLNAPNLGACTKFAVFTSVGAVNSVGTTQIIGDVGSNVGPVTGFPPGILSGDIHVGDVTTLQASNDLTLAYSYLSTMTCTAVLGTTMGNNQTLTPGIYCTGAASSLNGALTLDGLGNQNSLFVIQIDGALSTSTFSSVSLINGASKCNVYWQINGAFNLGDFSVFRGNVLANGALTMLTGSSIYGRALSTSGAINLASVIAEAPIPFALTLRSNQDYLYTNESATYTTSIKCGCPEDNVVPTITIPSGLTYQNGGAFLGNTVTFPPTTFAEDQTISFTFNAMLNNTVTTPTSMFYDGVEGAAKFTPSHLSGAMSNFSINTSTPLFENRSWGIRDTVLASDAALRLNTAIAIPAVGNYSLHFNHQYLTDTMDGGVVEFSTNGGTVWTDAAPFFMQNAYNDTLNFVINNTLVNRRVFTRSSNGKRESIIDVSSFNGQNLLFRFRFATNSGNGAAIGLTGWKIDRIWLANTVPCLPLTAEAMQLGVSKASANFCQNISAMPLGFGFALTCPATIKSCNTFVTYPNATIANNEGPVTITYSQLSGTNFPNGTTTVFVNASDATGNTGTCSFDVMVNTAVPTINSLSVADTVIACGNTPVILTASMSDEYFWYRNGTLVSHKYGANNTYTVPLVASTYVYTLVVKHLGMPCLSTVSSSMTVITSIPTAIITLSGAAAYCADNPTTLMANNGMVNYEWKRSNVSVQSSASSTYTPTVSGNHNVTVTDSYGCTKTSAWVNLTIKALPVTRAGEDKNVCLGSSIMIGQNSALSYTYSWAPSTGLSNPFIAKPMASPVNTTEYILYATNTVGGCMISDTVKITVLALPTTPTTTTSSVGNMVVIHSNTPNASSINWYKNGAGLYVNMLPNSSITVYHTIPTNAYTVKSKGANGCLSNASSAVNVRIGEDKNDVNTTIIEGLLINAYPNPTEGILNIDIQNNDANEGTILLYNSLGQVVLEKNIMLVDKKANEQLDMTSLSEGIYTLLFLSNGKQSIVKVIKE